MIIRACELFDLPALYRICLLTADAGADATPRYRDPDLPGHVYAGPYPVADRGLSFVAVDEQGVAGYIVATADTTEFAAWLESSWWPELRERHPGAEAEVDPGDGTLDWQLIQLIHEPAAPETDRVAEYPAHLHIDLLPRAQGQGTGRRLLETLTDALRTRGVPGVHLGVTAVNSGAIAFYRRTGFVQLEESADGFTFGMELWP